LAELRIKGPVARSYGRLVEAERLEEDPIQGKLVEELDCLLGSLEQRRLSRKSSALGWLFGQKVPKSPKGVYIWGEVGRGKSMLMDLFFAELPHERKRRCHFNDFLQDAQDRLHRARQAEEGDQRGANDLIADVADALASEAVVLCFDEFTVTNIADAMILGRLFERLFEAGVTVVATSNVAPQNLYRDGLNRHLFLPFIAILEAHMDVFRLDARTDYRMERLERAPVFYAPLGQDADGHIQAAWRRLTGVEEGEPENLQLKGRVFPISQAASGVARIHFDVACREPRSAADYLALARNFHTVFLENVPIIANEEHNVVKRFILLIDTLYDTRTRLVISAQGEPETLYAAEKGTEAFEFKRTISRLHEMRSENYLRGH